jgi:large subunit ribosomal protein L4
MASLPVFDSAGKEVGKYEISPEDISATINKQLLHDVVVMYQASARQGTHKTKSRAEVAGTGKKMYRQKGTGNARAGSRRSNIRRGGGHAFARRNRDYSYRLPRKAVRAATRMAIAGKIRDEQVAVIDKLAMETPKTSAIAGMIKGIGLCGSTTLIATADVSSAVYRSARNIQGVSVLPVCDLNALEILKPRKVLFTREALDQLKNGVPAKAQPETSGEEA